MEWKQLLSTDRQSKKRVNKFKEDSQQVDLVKEFEDDYLSIISSQAFRRLQDKTQVFLLDKSDFVRTRLTHSIEVSTIARRLSELAIQKRLSYENNPKYSKYLKRSLSEDMQNIPEFETAIGSIVACAGLLHDTGNPPYGHYGENVIRKWFEKQFASADFLYNGKPVGELLNKQMKADFTRFEGNAQGLRIMSKSRHKKNSHDINLTYAVMNTLVKYPNPSDFTYVKEDVKKHKNGYYYAEQDIMYEIGTSTGTLIEGDYVRHPLVYIMEAADDIAYSTADLEDSVMKKCFTVDQFINFYVNKADAIDKKNFERLLDTQTDEDIISKIRRYNEIRMEMKEERRNNPDKKDSAKFDAWVKERDSLFDVENSEVEKKIYNKLEEYKEAYNKIMRNLALLRKPLYQQELRSDETDFVIFENWLTSIRDDLINSAAFAFSHNYEEIMNGTYNDDLFVGTFIEDTISIMKSAMAEYVYDCDDLVEMELAAKKVVESLLENFINAVLYYGEDESKISVIDDRFIRKIPSNFKADYEGVKEKIEASDKSKEDKEIEKLYNRFLMVTDYISGMTDSYASNLYKVINGIM